MKITATEQSAADFVGDIVVVGVYERELSPPAHQLDIQIGGAISRLVEAGDITGKPNELTRILAPAGSTSFRIFVVGLGVKADFNQRRAYEAAATASFAISAKPQAKVGFYLDDFWPSNLSEQAVSGFCVGTHGQEIYRTEKKQTPPTDVAWFGATTETIEHGISLGNSINLARSLVNRGPFDIYPVSFADEAAVVAEHHNLGIEIWDKQKLIDERCGCILAVGQGSVHEPRLVILRYEGGNPGDAPLALVGKGITFDSGGLSLKPSDGMVSMKGDMAGAATVLAAIKAIAALKLPINVTAYCGLAENMVSGGCYKLGDVLTSRNGKTVEVLNTDAEGRLVLADVLDVAQEQNPAAIIDLATLTGACVVALGLDVAGLMTNDGPLCDRIKQAAQSTGERMWELPMFVEFGEQVKSNVADLKNVGDGRWGGAITAAKFLEQFVGSSPWTHIDIAGPAFSEKNKPWHCGGATGFGVRSLVELAREMG